MQYTEGDRVVRLNPWALEPATTYTITLEADLKDQFEQTLGKAVTVPYTTGDATGNLWAPSDLHIFPATTNLQLNISAINLPENRYKAAYRAIQPTDLVYVNSAYPTGEGNDLLPAPDSWQSYPVNGDKNQAIDVAVPLREQLKGTTGMLAYGVQARTYQYQQDGKLQWRAPIYYGLVQLTNLGAFAQWFPESGLVRVHHLEDGSPVAAAKVEVYASKLDAKGRSQPRPCATGTTDSTGTLTLNLETLQSCIPNAGKGFTDPPQLLTIVREGQDWAFVRTLEWDGSYGYGISGGWNSNQPESRGTIFSDRQLYQPGETAWFTGAAYYLQNGQLQQDQNVRYTLTLRSPDGKETNLGTQTTNAYGTFSFKWEATSNQPLGYYTIQAKGDSGNEISGEFRVAEFKPPNFQVDLSLNQAIAKMGDTLTAQAESRYLFGPPVQSGKVDYYVTRTKAEDWKPGEWDDTYSFGRQWLWPETEPSISTDVLQTSTALDAQGKGSQTVSVANDLPYPMTYQVDAQVTDVSNLAVTASKTFVALPSDRLIGLKSDFVATAGTPLPIQVMVTNPKGEAIDNQAVRVELQQMNYSRVTQVIEGSTTPRDQVEYKTVDQMEVRSGKAPQSVTLKPPQSGSYRIRANFTDTNNDATATDRQVWATGSEAASWGDRYTNDRLELQLDKKTYQPGETATVLLQSPYPEAELYFAVVRHNTIYKTVTQVKGAAPQIQFQVTPDMLPNAAVEAVLVRRGAPLNQVEPGSLKDLVRVGFAPFNLSIQDQYLKVETQATESLSPGSQQTLRLSLKTAQGQPTQGQLTVMVVNEAVRQLTDYHPPDLVKTVYAEQPISVRFADNRTDVVLQPLTSPIEKGWGYGGGLSAGVGDTRIRTQFKQLAYYNGSVVTDANGQATVTFTLPDDLTTWRVMVVATDKNLHFGSGETTFIATKPLATNPILPQFARPGDRLQVGVSVTNTTGQPGNLTINGAIGGSLQLTDQKTANVQTQTPTGTTAYRFPVVVQQSGEGKIQFSSQLNGDQDAFIESLEVRPLAITEQVVETGTTQTQVQIPLKIDANVVNDAGGLDVTLASTLIPEIQAPAQQVLQEESLPFLEPAASRLAIATNLQSLSRPYKQTFASFNPAEQAAQAIARLRALQRPDGGFASYPGEEQSDPWVSPYAAESLAAATPVFQGTPAQVDQGMIDRLKSYLNAILLNPAQDNLCKQDLICQNRIRLRSLMALAALGDRRTDFLSDIYQKRDGLALVEQVKLARYLSQLPDWQQEATTLTTQLQEIFNETGRTVTVNLPGGWQWYGSATASQAEALRLLISRQATPEVRDRVLQGLLQLRRDGTWGDTYDNAQALTALVAYSQLETTPPNFAATAQLAGKTIATAQFQGYQKPEVTTTVPMADLPRGNQSLTLQKNGTGTLHYLAAYRYRLQGTPPGRFNGLRVTRDIRPTNQDKVLKRMGLFDPDQPLTVDPGQVFDIGLEIITDHPVDHLVITDPLPAGFEAVDASFQTATPYFQARGDRWQIGYQTIYRDRVVAYGDHLEAGVYTLHYLVRSVTPGTFLYPGAEAHLQYAPEEFGRSASSTLRVSG